MKFFIGRWHEFTDSASGKVGILRIIKVFVSQDFASLDELGGVSTVSFVVP